MPAKTVTDYWQLLLNIKGTIDARTDASSNTQWQKIRVSIDTLCQQGMALETLGLAEVQKQGPAMAGLIAQFNSDLNVDDDLMVDFAKAYIEFLNQFHQYQFDSKASWAAAKAINHFANGASPKIIRANAGVARKLQTKIDAYQKGAAGDAQVDTLDSQLKKLDHRLDALNLLYRTRSAANFVNFKSEHLPDNLHKRIASQKQLHARHSALSAQLLKLNKKDTALSHRGLSEIYDSIESYLTPVQREAWAENEALHGYTRKGISNWMFSFARFEDARQDRRTLLASLIDEKNTRTFRILQMKTQRFKAYLSANLQTDVIAPLVAQRTALSAQIKARDLQAIQNDPANKAAYDNIELVVTICDDLSANIKRDDDKQLIARMKANLLDEDKEPHPQKRLDAFRDSLIRNHKSIVDRNRSDIVSQLFQCLRKIFKIKPKAKSEKKNNWGFWPKADKDILHLERLQETLNVSPKAASTA